VSLFREHDHEEAQRRGHVAGHINPRFANMPSSTFENLELASTWRNTCWCGDGTDGSRSGIKDLKVLKESKIDSRIFTPGHHRHKKHWASDCELDNLEKPRLVDILLASIDMTTMVQDIGTSTEDGKAERFHRLRKIWFTEPRRYSEDDFRGRALKEMGIELHLDRYFLDRHSPEPIDQTRTLL